jgi:drug/metabolite transporter (DMT)-like permease
MSLKTKIAAAFAIVYVIWGSTYLAIRIGLESMPPLLMAGLRFLLAGTLLWLWCDFRREVRPRLREARNSAVVGLFLVAAGNGFVTLAEQSVPSGITAVVVAVGPVFTTLLGWALGSQRRPGAAMVVGLALGLAGVGLLMVGGPSGHVDPRGAGFTLLATFCWSCGVLYSQANALPESALRSNAVQMLAGSAAMLSIGSLRGEWVRFHPASITLASGLALAYLVVFGAIVGYSAYGWLLRHVSATAAGTTAYVNPAVAVLLGALWGERIEVKAILAMAAIFLGVWLIKRERTS